MINHDFFLSPSLLVVQLYVSSRHIRRTIGKKISTGPLRRLLFSCRFPVSMIFNLDNSLVSPRDRIVWFANTSTKLGTRSLELHVHPYLSCPITVCLSVNLYSIVNRTQNDHTNYGTLCITRRWNQYDQQLVRHRSLKIGEDAWGTRSAEGVLQSTIYMHLAPQSIGPYRNRFWWRFLSDRQFGGRGGIGIYKGMRLLKVIF